MTTKRQDDGITPRPPNQARTRLQAAALGWLRDEQRLRTRTLPTEDIADERGVARVRGFFARSRAAGHWVYGALWTLTIGAILAMANLPGVSARTTRFFQSTGSVVLGAGMACVVAAEVSRRRNRTRALIELRLSHSNPPTKASIAQLDHEAGGAEAWVVSAAAADDDTLASAHAHGVRCFVAQNHTFHEYSRAEKRPSKSASPDREVRDAQR